MYQNLNDIERLIYVFSKLPGIGKRSARRIILHLLKDKEVRMKSLIDNLGAALDNTNICKICGNITCHSECEICTNPSRDSGLIAVVEDVADLWALERGGRFNGKYHVLDFNRNNDQQLKSGNIEKLLARCQDCAREVVIATNATIEGQTTAWLIAEHIKSITDRAIKISRLASGIPVGGEIDYLDEGTLSAAFESRQDFG